ncbi:MAG: hypothetical protein JXR58_03845 [Bacteroidales bacterium]|nr:hypothetical protein [Bacteroidales bacterium]
MKTSFIVILSLALFFTACNSDDEPVPTVTSTSDVLETGSWKVSYYYDSDKDETSDFSAYSFSFNNDRSLVATMGSTVKNGTWSVYQSDGKTKMDINLGTAEPLEELNDDWIVVESSSSLIKLEDQSGDGSMDYLHFVKN